MAKYMCDQLITIFARDCPSDLEKKELLEVSYKELDVWGFPYHNEIGRQSAIENSTVAFDTLGIDPHDDLWQLLLPVDERGKGICLSKRNFG
jgi:RNA polymerase II elongation factor ELL